MNDSKRPLQSKTLLFNAMIALLAVLAEQSDLIRSLLSPGNYLLLTVVIALVNAWLRLQTSQPIKTQGQVDREQQINSGEN